MIEVRVFGDITLKSVEVFRMDHWLVNTIGNNRITYSYES